MMEQNIKSGKDVTECNNKPKVRLLADVFENFAKTWCKENKISQLKLLFLPTYTFQSVMGFIETVSKNFQDPATPLISESANIFGLF